MAPSPKESVIEDDQYFRVIINERSVDDISLDFFYKPHTITLLITCITGLLYFAFTRNEDSQEQNIWNGLICVLFFFVIISVLAFPNGPFTRPHPAIWRMVFGLSVFYFMLLLFLLFQTHTTIRKMMIWLYPELINSGPDEREYAVNCSDLSLQRLWDSLDVFILCHFFGWVTKALLIRHYGILWTISVMWEITEVVFAHLLPNFAECWWDAILLDILLCNGLGIWVGMVLCRKLEIRDYHWESIKDIHSTSGKIRRAVLQFTPVSWLYVRWLDPNSTTMRIIAVWILILAWLVVELNTFFLKHIFYLEPSHMLNLIRLVLICSISAPTIRQYYVYATDIRCKRVGTQLWVFCAIMLTESIICIKFGLQMFRQTEFFYIIIWLCIQVASSFICIYLCALFAQRWNKWKHLGDADSPIRSMKHNKPSAVTNRCSLSPSAYETASRGKVLVPPNQEGKREEITQSTDDLVKGSNQQQTRHKPPRDAHGLTRKGLHTQGDNDVDTAGAEHMIESSQAKDPSKSTNSRRRRNRSHQPQQGSADVDGAAGESKTAASSAAKSSQQSKGKTTQRSAAAEDVVRNDNSNIIANSISAQVESLMSGELLSNGYHKGHHHHHQQQQGGKRSSGSPSKQQQSNPRTSQPRTTVTS